MTKIFSDQLNVQDQTTKYLRYSSSDGQVEVDVLLNNKTVWLTQERMAKLFNVGETVISECLDNIYVLGELEREATVSILETVQFELVQQPLRELKYYNFNVVSFVGERLNSARSIQFKTWAISQIKKYNDTDFVEDEKRQKNGYSLEKDYTRELLERVRAIRVSERRIYQQVTDIFAACSVDYKPELEKKLKSKDMFYADVQDRFHYAITGQRSCEIIDARADSSKPLMGMSTYKNAPYGRVTKADVTIGKNYLYEKEIKQLERVVSGFLDYIEGMIERQNLFTMDSFKESVNKFLVFNEYKVPRGASTALRKKANIKAHAAYAVFNENQKNEPDFDREIKKPLSNKLVSSSINAGNEIRRDPDGRRLSVLEAPAIDNLDELSLEFYDSLKVIAQASVENKRLNSEKMRSIILSLCDGQYLTRLCLTQLLDRKFSSLRQHINAMIKDDLLAVAFPESSNTKGQAYIATNSLLGIHK